MIFNKKQRQVGLDIGSQSIKAIEVEIKNGCFEIVGLGIKTIQENPDFPRLIKELFEEARISSKTVNISFSGENVVARYLSMPKMTDAELKKAMVFKLEDHIPFKPEEVYTDYDIIGEEKNSKNRIMVFLVATKKDFLDERLALIREAGLEPKIVTIDTLAVKKTFYHNYPDKNQANIALLNIGDKITNLLITQGQIPYFVRDTRFGGDTITAAIKTKMELSPKEALELKLNLKNAPANILEIVKTTLINNLLNEIFVSLEFYENLTERRIDEIYISGGSSQLSGLTEFLREYLNLKAFILDPFKNLSFSPGLSKKIDPQQAAPYLAVATGLALEVA